MTLFVWALGLGLAGLMAGLSLTAILIFFDPIGAGLKIFILFYLSLFLALAAIFTLAGLAIRGISRQKRFASSVNYGLRQLEISFRQAVLLTAIVITALILQSQRILAWWNLLILVLLVVGAEWWLARRNL